MLAVFQRELKSYFTGFTGYIITAFLLLFEGIYVSIINILSGYSSFEFSLESITAVLLLIVPIISMRSMSEEKHLKTDQLLRSLPIRTSSIVLGKYFSLLAVLLVPTIIIGFYPIILNYFGNVNLLNAYACLFAFYLLATTLISICLFISSLTESQLVAAIGGFGTLMIIYLLPAISSMIPSTKISAVICWAVFILFISLIIYNITKSLPMSLFSCLALSIFAILFFVFNQSAFEQLFPDMLNRLAIFEKYELFTYGIFDIQTIIYYLCITVFFIFLTVQSFDKKRWC